MAASGKRVSDFSEQSKSGQEQGVRIAGKHQFYLLDQYFVSASCSRSLLIKFTKQGPLLAPGIKDEPLYGSCKVLVSRDVICFNFALHAY